MSAAAAPAVDQPPTASTDQHPPAAQLPPAEAPADRPPRKERSGAQKRKAAKAKGPKAAAAPGPAATLNREVRELAQQLEAFLVAPAVPMHMAEDHWPAEHVEQRGPALAHQVAELARRNAAFRAQLQRALAVSENGQLAFAAAAYLVPILIYYGLIPVPAPVRAQLQVPDRAVARGEAMPPTAAAVRSEDGTPQARPGAFTEQPPGTPGAAPASAAGAAAAG